MSLAESAESRKEKLQALRKRKAQVESGIPSDGPSTTNGAVTSGETKRKRRPAGFKFRNYDPASATIRKHDGAGDDDTVEKAVEGVMERVKKEDEARRAAELDLTNIQPKKPNWDLKRDLEKKLSKLEPATQSAIATLIRRRLQAAGGGGTEAAAADLVSSMAAGPEGTGKRTALVGAGDSDDDSD